MTWFGYTLIGLNIFGILVGASKIGKPAEVKTANDFALGIAISIFFIAGILFVGTGKVV